jgi:diguanylate cyclase (GGDEF)-like protein/PAS domain S-box-containing protein
MHADTLAELCLLAALGVLGAALFAMRADTQLLRRRQAEQETARRQWTRILGDAAFDGLLIHRQGAILQMNRALARMLGVRERESFGQHFATLARPDHAAALRAELEAPHTQLAEFCLLRANKTECFVEISSQNIELDGAPATVTALRDITQRLADAKTIARLTHNDALTGLPNRKRFCDLLAAALAGHDRQTGTLTVFKMDIDQFKAMNELLGRAGGDALLRLAAQRIAGVTAKEDLLARLGGDKFALLIACPANAQRAASLAGRLTAAFQEPFIIGGQLVKLSLSIGIAAYPDHAPDAEGLLRACAFALAQAERAGGGAVHIFSHQEHGAQRPGQNDAQRLGPDLRQALARGDIRLAYQPSFRLADLRPAAFEVLPHWHHASEGVLPPERFMPLADAAGLTHELAGFILEQACAEAAGAPGSRLAVNLAAAQLRDVNLAARIGAVLRKTGLAPACLEVEISETLAAQHQSATLQTLSALAAIGVAATLDGFGAGQGSLNLLTAANFTRVKLAPSAIEKLGTDPKAEAVLAALLRLAAGLRLEVTALGVERPEQLEILRRLGCPNAQGRLLAPPGPRPLASPPPPRPALVVAHG